MKRQNIKQALVRSIAIVGAVMALVSGVTYAALQSQPGVFRGSTIHTAIASLQVSNNGTTFGSTIDGLGFNSLVPGGSPSPSSGYPVYVRNVGTAPLAIKLSVPTGISNLDNVDLNKVHVLVTPFGIGTAQNITLQDLITSPVSIVNGGRMIAGQTSIFTMQVSLDADAVTGPSGSITNIDFTFGGAAVN
ncbi:MAG: hypothetical protein QFB86_03245 [Patescibacteria group bacterium]|nr:hypothetical protein [Patescibacteria group bacterium]